MKKLSLLLGVIVYCLNPISAQYVSYNYEPHVKEIIPEYKCPEVNKVYCSSTKYSTKSLRLLDDNKYERLAYSKNRKTITIADGFYKLTKKNFLYLNRYKMPRWYNYKHCNKYLLAKESIYYSYDTEEEKPLMSATVDPSFYKETNFNPLRGEYYFGRLGYSGGSLNSSCSTKYLSVNTYIKQKYIEVTQEHIPEYEDLITNSFAGPSSLTKYIDDKPVRTKTDTSDTHLAGLFETVIHESIHQKNYELTSDSLYGYYISESKSSFVPFDESLYTSDALYESIDTNEFFGFNAFSFHIINEYLFNTELVSNKLGIYGILNEFTAYAHEAKVALKLSQLNLDSTTSKLSSNALFNVKSIPNFYYSFNIMIGWYLEYAKLYDDEAYQKMYANQELRKAYTEINNLFENSINNYDQLVNSHIFPKEYDFKNNEDYTTLLKAFERQQNLLNEFKL